MRVITYSPRSHSPRFGFTLVELLVVIAILAVLLVLGAGATFKVLDTQKVAASETSLRTVDKVLLTQWDKVVKDASAEDVSPAVKTLANGDEARARVLWIKFRLAEAFPQSFNEIRLAKAGLATGIYGPANYIPPERRANMKRYYDAIASVPVGPTSPSESSACLLLALSVPRGAKLGEGDPGASVADTDGDGIKEFIDNWGKPLRFQRFGLDPATDPISLEIAKTNPRAGQGKESLGDPLDPDGFLQHKVGTLPWCRTSNGTTFANLCMHPFPLTMAQPYSTPYVASSGRDGIPLTEDDVYSFRLKVGARGD